MVALAQLKTQGTRLRIFRQALLHASSVLQLDPLTGACSDFVHSHLEPSNVLGVWQFAESHGLQALARSAERFARSRFPQVAASREFLALSSTHLDRLLVATDLGVDAETQARRSHVSRGPRGRSSWDPFLEITHYSRSQKLWYSSINLSVRPAYFYKL